MQYFCCRYLAVATWLLASIFFLFVTKLYFFFFYFYPGHVDPGESDWVTALRETKEEAGLSESDLEVSQNYYIVMRLLTFLIKKYFCVLGIQRCF